jgi:hypothetical protein
MIDFADSGRFLVRKGSVSVERVWNDYWQEYEYVERGEDTRWAVLNSRGNEILPMGMYDSISPAFNDRYIVWQGSSVGVVDERNRVVVDIGRYDGVGLIGGGAFFVRDGDRIGALDLRGREIIPIGRYDRINGIYGGLAIVRDSANLIGLVNTGKIR